MHGVCQQVQVIHNCLMIVIYCVTMQTVAGWDWATGPCTFCMQTVARLTPDHCAMHHPPCTTGRFVETRSGPEYSIVAQALAAAMRGLLQEWLLMVTQLEHTMRKGQLGMQALLYHCQAPMASLRLLAGISVSGSLEMLQVEQTSAMLPLTLRVTN